MSIKMETMKQWKHMQSEKPKSHKCSLCLKESICFHKNRKKYSSYCHICKDFTIFSVYSVVKIQRLKQFYKDKGCVEYDIRMAFQVLSVFDPFSVQFSRSDVSDSLPSDELQHARPLCSSPTQEVHPNSCPSSRWHHPSSHLFLCRPLLLLSPIPPSIRVFSNESTLHMRWPKYWSFSLSISPSNEHPELIFFRMTG